MIHIKLLGESWVKSKNTIKLLLFITRRTSFDYKYQQQQKNSINFSIWKHIYFQSAKSERRPGQNQSVGVVPTQRQALPIRRQDTCSGAGVGPIPHNPNASRENLLLSHAQLPGVLLIGSTWVTCSPKTMTIA